MRVYTYYEPLKEMQDSTYLIELWKQSWNRNGWDPIVLDERRAKEHPQFEHYLKTVSQFPTVNPKNYEAACFKRWLAMEKLGGGWLVDYDVMNYGFKPVKHADKLTLHAGDWCPCVTSGNQGAFSSAIAAFQSYHGPWETYPGNPHISDQDILKNRRSLSTSSHPASIFPCPAGATCSSSTIQMG